MSFTYNTDYYLLIEDYISSNRVMIFSSSTCPHCAKIKSLFDNLDEEYFSLELDTLENGAEIQKIFFEMRQIIDPPICKTTSNLNPSIPGRFFTLPQIFVNRLYLGGYNDGKGYYQCESLRSTFIRYDDVTNYDLIVIGGGLGGLVAAKESLKIDDNLKVGIVDSVMPQVEGNTSGLQETHVYDTFIFKRIMHLSTLLRETIIRDAKAFGWDKSGDAQLNWTIVKENLQQRMKFLRWNYRNGFWDMPVNHINGYAQFVDPHNIKIINKKGKECVITGKNIIIATGDKPLYPDIEGAKEYGITSDELFFLEHSPGKTLIVGGSVLALEIAGILAALGLDVTVMARSALLRGFDQEMTEKITDHMKSQGIKFLRPCMLTKIAKNEEKNKLDITANKEGEEIADEYDTLLFAIGREARTDKLGLDKVGVEFNATNGKIPVVENKTNVPNIYAIGDVIEGHSNPSMAITTGKLLAHRLFDESQAQYDYFNSPFTVFTPLEYSCIGYTAEDAIKAFGKDDIEIYVSKFNPSEWTVAKRDETKCYVKVICHIPEKEKIIGFHYLGPKADEVTQGFALAMKKGATKADFDQIPGLLPFCEKDLDLDFIEKFEWNTPENASA